MLPGATQPLAPVRDSAARESRQGLAEYLDSLGDFGRTDVEWRDPADDLVASPARQHQQPGVGATGHQQIRQRAIGLAGCRVTDELDTDHQASPSDVADPVVLGGDPAKSGDQLGTAGCRVGPEVLIADRTFTDAWSENLGGEKITARTYTPAHTGGDAIVVFEDANVVHMGDLMFNRAHPVIDRAAGASIANWMKMLEQIHKAHNSDTVFICGHNNASVTPLAARADLLNFRDYLTALMGFVGDLVKEGKTREEVLARRDVLKGFEDYGPLVARPLPAAFDEITAGK